jgi:hypothetical protein
VIEHLEVRATVGELCNEQVSSEEEVMQLEFGSEKVPGKPSEPASIDDDATRLNHTKPDVITDAELAPDKPKTGDDVVVLVNPLLVGS